MILSFNLAREEFEVVLLPSAIELKFEQMGVLMMRVFQERIAVIDEGLDIHVWVMKEYGVRDSWTKFAFHVPEWHGSFGIVSLLNDYELVLQERDKLYLIACDSRKCVWKNLAVGGVPGRLDCTSQSDVWPFRGSLVSPKHLS